MAEIPRAVESLVDRIYESYEREEGNELYLSRIGASSIGGECLREIWFSWRGFYAEKIEGRILRLFKTGNIQEERLIKDLRNAGCVVFSHDEETGNQFSFSDSTGHFVVKPDGVITGVPSAEKAPHLLELKSVNLKGYEGLVKNGLQKEKPEHYYQIQAGMKYAAVDRGLYISVCKDNEKMYVERVHPDKDVQADIEFRIMTLLKATMPPAQIATDKAKYPCSFCDAKEVCYGDEAPLRHCRTCENVYPYSEGAWVCTLTGSTLSKDEQLKGCEHYSCMMKG